MAFLNTPPPWERTVWSGAPPLIKLWASQAALRGPPLGRMTPAPAEHRLGVSGAGELGLSGQKRTGINTLTLPVLGPREGETCRESQGWQG